MKCSSKNTVINIQNLHIFTLCTVVYLLKLYCMSLDFNISPMVYCIFMFQRFYDLKMYSLLGMQLCRCYSMSLS